MPSASASLPDMRGYDVARPLVGKKNARSRTSYGFHTSIYLTFFFPPGAPAQPFPYMPSKTRKTQLFRGATGEAAVVQLHDGSSKLELDEDGELPCWSVLLRTVVRSRGDRWTTCPRFPRLQLLEIIQRESHWADVFFGPRISCQWYSARPTIITESLRGHVLFFIIYLSYFHTGCGLR